LPYANAGLPRRADALLAMTRCGANGRGGSSQFSDAWPSAVIARKVSKRTDVAIQSEALHGMPGRCGGCRTRSAGLPRRYAPRNDNAKTWGMLKRPPDCRVAVLRPGFRAYPLCCHCEPGRAWQSGLLTFMSLRGRSRRELRWQSSLRRYAGCGGDAVGCRTRSAGLPRQADAFLAMTTQKHWGCPNGRWIAASRRSSQ
jgi:hypothetical protein